MKTMAYFLLSLVLLACVSLSPSKAYAKSYWLTGAFIGGGVGLGAGLGIGLGASCSNAGSNNEDCDISRSTLTAITTPTGAVVGFGLGALIGSFIKKKDKTAQFGNSQSSFMPSIMVDPLINSYGVGATLNF
jgi:hypothetical protein